MTTVEPDNMNTTPPAPPEPPPATPASAPKDQLRYKHPLLAAGLSLFPGIGNIYNGLYMRGLAFFLICVSMILLVVEHPGPLFGMAIPFFWILNVIDAYRQAVLINYGYSQDLGVDEPPKMPSAGQGGLMVGIILFAIGGIALLEQLNVRVDLSWLFDLWPAFLMLIGAWLIFDTIKDKMKKKEEGAVDL